jgi:hypothetical protein
MFNVLLRILFGYALSAFAATAAAVTVMAMVTGGWSLGWRDIAAGAFIIGLTAWGGLLFAIKGEIAGWTQPLTYVWGGLFAMATGVATVTSLGVLQGLLQGYTEWDVKHALSLLWNVAELLALGFVPGIAGGLTYWLVSVRRDRERPV